MKGTGHYNPPVIRDGMKYYHMDVSAQGRFVFLPAEKGRYIRTDFSAFFVGCSDCEADAGTPCYNMKSYLAFDVLVFQAATHSKRKAAYQLYKRAQVVETAPDGKILKLDRRKA